MGYSKGHEDEQPVHTVNLDSFYLDRYEVSNREFYRFVDATGYVTQAEKDGYSWCYLRGQDEFVQVEGANWRHPNGPASDYKNILNHPVVCVSWHDANAYATWANKRLPTEAEWEYAARGGQPSHYQAGTENNLSQSNLSESSLQESSYRVKTQTLPLQYISANFWQGTWPENNQLDDDYYYTSPIGKFEANAFGIHDMVGNVWEWCSDWYAGDYYNHSPVNNPQGPEEGTRRIARGGSWFCSQNYCQAYNTHFRGGSPPTHTFNNVGFRCAADVENESN